MYVSPTARLVEAQDTKLLEPFLLSGGLDATSIELACLEAVMLGERKCHANWQFLSKMAGSLPHKKANKAIQKAVDKVQHEEDEHVAWVETAWEQLMMSQVQ